MKLYFYIIPFILFSCKPKPQFYINGKPYYTVTSCVKSHAESKYTYHYGYNILNGKFEWHLGPETVVICDKTRTDTIEIK